MKTKLLGLSLVVIVAIAIIGGFFFPKGNSVVNQALGVFSGPDIYDDVRFYGKVFTKEFTQGGGTLSIATSSGTYTLTQAELAEANVIKVSAAGVTDATLSLTLPATSTMTTLLPNDGDTRDWTIWNNYATAATTTTVVAGTGIDLQGDGTGDDVINGGVFAKLRCVRLNTLNVMCYINEGVAAD